MRTPKRLGQASVFLGKDRRTRFQGIMRTVGRRRFEAHRRTLRALYREVVGRQPEKVSDGDTVEYLSIGEADTRAYLETLK